MAALVAPGLLARGAFQQHPFVAFAEDGKLEVFLAVDDQVQATVVERPRRQSHVAPATQTVSQIRFISNDAVRTEL